MATKFNINNLVIGGIITAETLAEQREAAKNAGFKSLINYMLSVSKVITKNDYYTAYAMSNGWTFTDVSTTPVNKEDSYNLPAALARVNTAVVTAKDNSTGWVEVATDDPGDLNRYQTIQSYFSSDSLRLVYAPKQMIENRLQEIYSLNLGNAIGGVFSPADSLKKILDQAVSQNTSDIHLLRKKDKAVVRFRINGTLVDVVTLSSADADELIRYVKTLTDTIKTDITYLPQDGQFTINTVYQDIDVRVVTVPTIFNETMVLRLLNTRVDYDLDNLHMPKKYIDSLKNIVQLKSGILLVVGATGAGKTSTLYALLKHIESGGKNIMTVEDPVEMQREGITQVSVNRERGLTYEKALHSFLRADPDVILIGEIREAETARTAIEAAQTGHMVLGTLHTKRAIETVTRLKHLDVSSYMIESSVKAVLAQDLLPVLCNSCKVKKQVSAYITKMYERESIEPPKRVYYKSDTGCKDCIKTGITGRIAVFELLLFDAHVRRSVLTQDGTEHLVKAAAHQGFETLLKDVLLKVKAGIVDPRYINNFVEVG